VFQTLEPRKPTSGQGQARRGDIFANGGASQVDTFDPKALLTE